MILFCSSGTWKAGTGHAMLEYRGREEGTMTAKDIRMQFQISANNPFAMPFWAWNGAVSRELLQEQLPCFMRMGMGGFVIHSRTGLKTPFLGDEYMEAVRLCADYAARQEMRVWLYDEDRWPSGYGGGLVTQKQAYRPKYLAICRWKREEIPAHPLPSEQGRLDLVPKGDGILRAVLQKDGQAYYVYEETMGNASWFNGQAYVDTMNPKAVDCFLHMVYETCERQLRGQFGTAITAMFTDEPQVSYKRVCRKQQVQENGWLAVFPYSEALGDALWTQLPLIFWGGMELKARKARYWYHKTLAEQFTKTYCKKVGEWCRRHEIGLTGHLRGEKTLQSQTASLGEAMINYKEFSIPGVDILCNQREYTTVKQVQSVARQMEKEGVSSEMYGVTGWEFDFLGHKRQGEWQAVLGITHRVHHLAWMSMEGEAKRDFPASLFYQLPWYEQYWRLEAYFRRIGIVLRQGKPVVRLLVIHPIESFWMLYGDDGLKQEQEQMEWEFERLAEWLLTGFLDFDYLSEALLGDGLFNQGRRVGAMEYQAILIPPVYSLRPSTLDFLDAFQQAGGTVWTMGDRQKQDGASAFWKRAISLDLGSPWRPELLWDALKSYRDVEILDDQGRVSHRFLYQLREDAGNRWLFVVWHDTESSLGTNRWRVRVKGSFQVERWDGMSGATEALLCRWDCGWTQVSVELYPEDSLILRFRRIKRRVFLLDRKLRSIEQKHSAGSNCSGLKYGCFTAPLQLENLFGQDYYLCRKMEPRVYGLKNVAAWNDVKTKEIWEPVGKLQPDDYEMEEDNVAVLTQAAWCLGNGAWETVEELLRLEEHLRRQFGYEESGEYGIQPWVAGQRENQGIMLRLAFSFTVTEPLEGICFAAERLSCLELWLDESPILREEDSGWYVDRSIPYCHLPLLAPGPHRIIVQLEFHSGVHLEWCYLLGAFHAAVWGSRIKLKRKSQRIAFGPWKTQGLPFYGGNLTYRCRIQIEEGDYQLQVPHFAAPLLLVFLDGREMGILLSGSSRVTLGHLSGNHCLEIKTFGNRINTFGAVHNTRETIAWYGPSAWRSKGREFSYAYQLRDTGILSAPVLWRAME